MIKELCQRSIMLEEERKKLVDKIENIANAKAESVADSDMEIVDVDAGNLSDKIVEENSHSKVACDYCTNDIEKGKKTRNTSH